MQADFDYCATLVRDADRDRYLATLFAPAKQRDALNALYAFNIEIARVREKAREPMPGEIRLQWWREVLSGERDGEAAAHPVAAALRETLARYNIAADRLIALIDAHAFDLYDEPMANAGRSGKLRRQDSRRAVCDGRGNSRAAGRGGSSADAPCRHRLFNRWHPARLAGARRAPAALSAAGIAGAAWRSNREAIFARQAGAPLRAALGELRRHARRHLAAARAELDVAPPEILPALLPAATVGPALRRMERRGYEPFEVDQMPGWRRQWWLWRAARDPSRIFHA